MTQQRARTPWTTNLGGTIHDADGKPVACGLSGCPCGNFSHHKDWFRDNARLIVQAVNAHEALLAALQEIADSPFSWTQQLAKLAITKSYKNMEAW